MSSSTIVPRPTAALVVLLLGPVPEDRQAEFLRRAEVVESLAVGSGTNETLRLALTDGETTHDASFQSVDERAAVKELPDGSREIAFVDSYRYNVAAYRLARLLGLSHMVPASVKRSFRGKTGALTWWIDDVAMNEADMRSRGLSAPKRKAWSEQIYRVRVFSELIHDTDRNRSNLLITRDWKIWMIDFTRAFRRWPRLVHKEWLLRCDRVLFDALGGLSRESLDEELSDILSSVEIEGVWSRRSLILEHYERLIQERGESQVLY